MTKEAYKNEQQKREFLEYLGGGEGFEESSVNTFAEAVSQWQEFTENEDFASFNKTKALGFRDWLKNRKANTEAGHLALTTQYNYLRRIKKFFTWLSKQPRYKNKIIQSDIKFLRLSKGDARIARQGTTRKIPTFEEAKQIIQSIKINNEIDMRDRALISFALITGARISAITTLKIKSFDLENKIINQNPKDGVKTKNKKHILTTFFPIGWDKPEEYFIEWFKYLIEEKKFNPDDPIFPATLKGFSNQQGSYSKNSVSNKFWSSSSGPRKIFEKRCLSAGTPYFHPHLFRHLIVQIITELRFTKKEERALSMNLGHANIGTTFNTYGGYGSMGKKEAVDVVKQLKEYCANETTSTELSKEEKYTLKKVLHKII